MPMDKNSMWPFTSSEAEHAKIDHIPYKCRGCKDFITLIILLNVDAATRRAQVINYMHGFRDMIQQVMFQKHVTSMYSCIMAVG